MRPTAKKSFHRLLGATPREIGAPAIIAAIACGRLVRKLMQHLGAMTSELRYR